MYNKTLLFGKRLELHNYVIECIHVITSSSNIHTKGESEEVIDKQVVFYSFSSSLF